MLCLADSTTAATRVWHADKRIQQKDALDKVPDITTGRFIQGSP